jgi:hypothetical protein
MVLYSDEAFSAFDSTRTPCYGLRFALLLAEQLAFHVSAVTTAEG